MRERGTQSRRVRPGPVEPSRPPGPPSRSGTNFWQVLAIVALVAATAGWTTVAVMALRPPAIAAVDSPTDSFNPEASDDEVPPVDNPHEVPELEALLPAQVSGTAMEAQSMKGDSLLSDDPWSVTVRSFLTDAGKTDTDLLYAQAYDPQQVLEVSVDLYRVAGVEATPLRDALVETWKGDDPGIKVSQVTLGGKAVTKGDFTEDGAPTSYLYVRDDVVYDIWTSDEAVAIAALGALPQPGASGAPASGAPASGAPGASGSPASSTSAPSAAPS